MADFIEMVIANPIPFAVGFIVFIFILFRLWKTARMYMGAKRFVRKSKRSRKKKFNGLILNDKIRKKRKKNTNAFNKLRRGAKKKVRRYTAYKVDELRIHVQYSYGKLLRRTKEKLLVKVTRDSKVLKKIKFKKKPLKMILDVTTKYSCLDEMIIFLHELPDAILEQQEFEIYSDEGDVTITYEIK